jgi:mannose-6-phosphate isomerase-like protein (cupin superfamily)
MIGSGINRDGAGDPESDNASVTEPFDLATTHIHLGLGARAIPVPDFEWSDEFLTRYEEQTAADGDEGRLVMISTMTSTWDFWERHPAGEEVVVLLSGRSDLVQEVDGEERAVELLPGQAVINPTGVWHRSVVHEPGDVLFITPGRGTEHRPLDRT